jgi:hypothetical protein
MPKGPTITHRVRELIAKVHYEHTDWRAKEVQHEVNALLAKGHPGLNPDWPGLSAIQKELNRLRKSPNPQDKPWNMLTLSEYELPPEALPAVLHAWFHTRLNSSHPFTVREAKWVARLHCIMKDIDQLTKIAHDYASGEYIGERYGPGFVVSAADYKLFEILTGQVLSLDQMDKLLDEPLKGLWETFRNTEWWTEEDILRAKKEAIEKGLMKDSEGPRLDSIK